MTFQEIIDNYIKTNSKDVEFRMKEFGENYATAKEKVKQGSCAGPKVWEIIDKRFN